MRKNYCQAPLIKILTKEIEQKCSCPSAFIVRPIQIMWPSVEMAIVSIPIIGVHSQLQTKSHTQPQDC